MGTDKLTKYLKQEVSVTPLVIFRIAFGSLMLFSISRFIYKGWVYTMYVMPKFYFPYFGFEWIKPLPEFGMYLVFTLLLLSSIGIVLGAFYRWSAILFFLLFTYVELIDKTNYLNHYYFISLVSFIIIFLPGDRHFSLDNKWLKRAEQLSVQRIYILIPQLQMFLVYFFAGVAKINSDWLLEAQPLRIWLPAFSHFPLIGRFLEQQWLALVFCWFACIYDLLIGFFLFNRRTVYIAYVFVIIFHAATALFFNIGMFPFIMMTITFIFFREEFHSQVLNGLKKAFSYTSKLVSKDSWSMGLKPLVIVFAIFFSIQVVLPFRYLLYPGHLFWTEQGYRFSWRVMLMEKAGTAFFYVQDRASKREVEVNNKNYLSYMQEKMMATQPDMMVDYAIFLKGEFEKKGFVNPAVKARSYVTVNGSGSREFIDPTVDLSIQSHSIFENKTWVRSY